MKFKKAAAALTAISLMLSQAAGPLDGTLGIFNDTHICASAEETAETNSVNAGKAVMMPENAISFTGESSVFQSVSVPQNGGIYYFNDNKIKFYDTANNTVSELADYTNTSVNDVYTDGSNFYILRYDYSYNASPGYTFYLDVYCPETESVVNTYDLSDYVGLDGSEGATAVGVDNSGRFYLSVVKTADGKAVYENDKKMYTIYLISPDFKELSSVDIDHKVYHFNAFDETNGNFYFEGYLNWVYWGYDHDTKALNVGNVTDDKITIDPKYIDVLYQMYFYYHYDNAALLNNKYLVWTSTLNGVVRIIDSNAFSIPAESLSPIASISRKGYENSKYESAGTRTLYNGYNDTFLMYANNNTIAELERTDDSVKQIASYKTEYPVFSMIDHNGRTIVIEKDPETNKYYTEDILWKKPEEISISETNISLSEGGSYQLSAKGDSDVDYGYEWTSSDNSVATVTSDGEVYANKAGTAVISVSCNGLTSSCTVKVSKKTSDKPNKPSSQLSGAASKNISANNYSVWSSVSNSYLYENSDGTLTRVENTSANVIVENYSADGSELLSSKKINKELTIFGGAFAGKDNNYMVFGQKNTEESDDTEVVRVVKYDKNWNRISECKINGANTYIPFEAGSLRMIELEGKLYVYTCHQMYAEESDPGVHHQANMLFTLDEAAMTVADSMYAVSNLGDGYVSHSFNQFIKTDGTYIYRVDQSESNNFSMGSGYLSVNGITLTKYHKDNESTKVSRTVPYKFKYHSGNYTGVSIGGFELGKNTCLIAYNEDCKSKGNRNVFVNVTDKLFNTNKTIQLTDYTSTDKTTCYTPQLVKINSNLFAVMWEEYNSSTAKTVCKVELIDGNGSIVSSSIESFLRLSDCQPILCSDKTIKWYVTDGGAPIMYSIDPYDILAVHKHSYESKITKKAACETAGERTYTCKICGDSYTESIAATGHKTVKDKAVAATCITDGKTEGSHCSVCGRVIKAQTVIKAAGHKYDNGKVTKQPTCTAEGVKTYTCSVCGAAKTEAVKAKGHTIVTDKAVAAACTTDGKTEGPHCSVCGAVIKAQTVIKATGHKYDDGKITKQPTCTATGVKTFTCSECGATKTETIKANGHTEVIDKAVAATCTTDGKTEGSHCSVCGKVIKAQTVIKATGHNFGSWNITKSATCTESGSQTRTCTACGKTETKTIPAKGHTSSKWIIDKQPAVGVKGSKHKECTVCGKVLETAVIPALGSADISEATVTLSATSYAYNGKAKKPAVTVTLNGKTLKKDVDYTVKYSSNTAIGKAKVTVAGKGKYVGIITKSFKILPAKQTIAKITSQKNGFALNWTKDKNVTGYQIQYDVKSDLKSAKSTYVKSNTTYKKTISGLKTKKTYYVRVRSYKTVGGVKYYGSWSGVKSVKTK